MPVASASSSAEADPGTVLSMVVLISGSGTNLQAIIERIEHGELAVRIAAVISNEPLAFGLERARRAGIAARCVDHRDYSSRAAYDTALAAVIDEYEPGLIILAGYMRILTASLVARYAGRVMNIHPSLLPAYPGLDTHARVLADGATEHGATVHFVTAELDSGPIIIQQRVAVLPDDGAESLQQRVHRAEYQIYPQAIGWFAAGRLSIDGERVLLDGQLRP